MSMTDIGEKLRQAREKKSLTIEQVQKQTLIHAPILNALEEGKCDGILSPAYVKSFLKKYAVFLGLDPKELLNDYALAHSEERQAPVNVIPEKNTKPKKVEVISQPKNYGAILRRVVIAVAVLAVGAIIIFILVAGGRFVSSIIKKANKSDKTTVKTKKISAKSEKAANKKGAEKEKFLNSIKTIIPKNAALNIVVKVKSPVWVEMKKDGEKFFQRVLPKGWAEPMTARDKIELFIANGEVVEIFLNGKSLGSPGKGVIKNLEITRSGMKVK